MRALSAMIRKEFTHIRRDPQLIGFVLALPVLLLILFGYALRLKIDHLEVVVWDQDQNFFSATVKDRLRQAGQLYVVEVQSEQAIRDKLRSGEAPLGLVIPKGFAQRLADGQQTEFPLFVDGTMPTLAQGALYGARVLTSEDAARELQISDEAKTLLPPIKVDQHILYNPDLRDSDFFLPGTIGIVIMLVVLTLSAGLVREKEQQTIEQLLATPISRFALIAGKMIPYGMIAALDFIVAVVIADLVFHLPFRGSLISIGALAVLFILSLLALGALISTVSQTQLQANFMAVFIIVPSVLMSGFVFPIEAMPFWLRPVAWALPMTYFVEAIRGLTLKATPVLELQKDFWALAGFMIVFTLLSLTRFRKTLA